MTIPEQIVLLALAGLTVGGFFGIAFLGIRANGRR